MTVRGHVVAHEPCSAALSVCPGGRCASRSTIVSVLLLRVKRTVWCQWYVLSECSPSRLAQTCSCVCFWGQPRLSACRCFALWCVPDANTNTFYVVSYPTGAGATIYYFDRSLSLLHTWTPKSLSLFDLQYSARQKQMFGIAVNGTYGRVLSLFECVCDERCRRCGCPCGCVAVWVRGHVHASAFGVCSKNGDPRCVCCS